MVALSLFHEERSDAFGTQLTSDVSRETDYGFGEISLGTSEGKPVNMARVNMQTRGLFITTVLVTSVLVENFFPLFSSPAPYLTRPVQPARNDTNFGSCLVSIRCITLLCIVPVIFK